MVQRLLSEYFLFYIQISVSTKPKETAEVLYVTKTVVPRLGAVAKALTATMDTPVLLSFTATSRGTRLTPKGC